MFASLYFMVITPLEREHSWKPLGPCLFNGDITSDACIPKELDSLDSGSITSNAKVGKDAMGQSLLEQISGQGFPTDTIKMFSNLPSSVCIVLSGPADRAFVSCYSTTDAFTTRDLREPAGSSMRQHDTASSEAF